MKDLPVSFFERNDLDRNEDNLAEIDSLLKEKLASVGMSSVVEHLNISFQLDGKHLEIWKSSTNFYWFFQPDGEERTYPLRIGNLAFNAFLMGHLPKKFSGLQVLD